jgi:vanillate O-demethylase ferredoxin subunit
MKTLSVRVLRRQPEATDIISLELGASGGGLLPEFSAGSHIDIHIKPGLIRQYSLCNDPQERSRYVIGVLRDPASRGGSVAIHDEIREGDLLTISAPRNHFPLVRARRSLLLAGGIGITPLLCMAEQLAQIHADFELHYCARSTDRAAFRKRIAASEFASRVQYHYDDGAAEQLLDLEYLLDVPDNSCHIYVCGPTGFIDHVCNAATTAGWRAANVHYEYFGAPAPDTSGDTAFDVEIASTGEVVNIPAGQSVADVLKRFSVDIDVACERGICGTCVTGILEGTPEHRDHYLSADDRARGDLFTPCCSRAKTPLLVLDL